MRSLRALIEDQEQKEVVHKKIDEKEEIVENIDLAKEKIEKYKQYLSHSELVFPELYLNKELYELALKINDSFMLKLKSD